MGGVDACSRLRGLTMGVPLSEPSSSKRIKLSSYMGSTSPVKGDKLRIGSRFCGSVGSPTASTLGRTTDAQGSSVKSASQVYLKTSSSNRRVYISPLDYHSSASERRVIIKRVVLNRQNNANRHLSSETCAQNNQRLSGQSRDKSKPVRFNLLESNISQPEFSHERSRSVHEAVTRSTSSYKSADRRNLSAAPMEKLKRRPATTTKGKIEKNLTRRYAQASKKTQECFVLPPKCSESINFEVEDTCYPTSHCSSLQGSCLPILEQSEHNESECSRFAEVETVIWKPVEPEKQVRDYHYESRDQLKNQRAMTLMEKIQLFADSFMNDSESIISDTESPDWYIVIDTSVLLGNLCYVEELLSTNVKDFGSPVLVVPWNVLQELDRFKGGRYNAMIGKRARNAINFLHKNLCKHPRLKGQSVSEANPTKVTHPDDSILVCCLQKAPRVVLLSNDRNLRNKSVIRNVTSYSVFEMKIAIEKLNGTASPDETANRVVSEVAHDMKNQLGSSTSFSLNKENQEASKAQVTLYKLMSSLKELLSHIMEQEMVKAFGRLWIKVVFIKPPWILVDLLACFINHWIGVFSFVFPKSFKTHIDELKESLSQKDYGHSLGEVHKMIDISVSLCLAIPSREYGDQITKCMKVLDKLQLGCSDAPSSWNNRGSAVSGNIENGINEELGAVRDAFIPIWQTVGYFCAVLHEALGLEHNLQFALPNPLPSMTAIDQKLPEMYDMVHSIIQCTECILDTHPSQLSPQDPALIELHTRIMDFYASLQDPDDVVSPELLYKFCIDTDYRWTKKDKLALLEWEMPM